MVAEIWASVMSSFVDQLVALKEDLRERTKWKNDIQTIPETPDDGQKPRGRR